MKVQDLTEKGTAAYEKFVQEHPFGSVHQTSRWGQFQTKLSGRDKFWCLAVEDKKGKIMASALVIRQTLPLKKSWLYCPMGPLADYYDPAALNALLQKIKEIAREQNAVFFRFEPPLTNEEKIDWKRLNARPAHARYQPENTLVLDLSLTEEELLKQMKPKGRYNIKIAQKHGVTVRTGNAPEDIDAFYDLLLQTTGRDKFSGHNKRFYADMLEVLGPQKAKLYLAEYRPKPSEKPQVVAGMIVTVFKDTATYYFGASSSEHRNVMAPYLLQWQAILDAKNHGCKHYDFLGIAPTLKDNPEEIDRSHPWAGVTDFKLKFGGRRVDYQPAQEIVYQPFWYAVIRLMKKFRK